MKQTSFVELEPSCLTTFFRMPHAGGKYSEFDVVFIGIPFDGGASYHPGSRHAPDHIRRCSRNLSHPSLRSALSIGDAGNVSLPFLDIAATHATITRKIRDIAASGAVPVAVGGDHSITIPCVQALAEQHGPLFFVQFDAHPDTGGSSQLGNPLHHGAVMSVLLHRGHIQKNQLCHVGLRVEEDSAFSDKWGIVRWRIEDIEEEGIETITAKIREKAQGQPVYLSIDIDVLDPAYAPGTGIAEPGGITSREAIALIRGLRGLRVVGIDLVEVLPPRDSADITGLLASRLLFESAVSLILPGDCHRLESLRGA